MIMEFLKDYEELVVAYNNFFVKHWLGITMLAIFTLIIIGCGYYVVLKHMIKKH